MNTALHQVGQTMINEPVPSQALHASKAFRHDSHMKMAALARTGVPRVLRAVITHLQFGGCQRFAQPRLDFCAKRTHGLPSPSATGGRCLLM